MKKIRRLPKWLAVLLLIALAVVVIWAVYGVIYNKTQSDISIIQEAYETRKEKCELLRTVADKVIREGAKPDFLAFPNEDIQYRISNEDEKIVIYYYIKEEQRSNTPQYYATITLSNNYDILEEQYSVELEDFETYKNNYEKAERLLAAIWAIGSTGVTICILVVAGALIFYTILRKNKKETP